jgi:hypothetical protein
MTGMALGWVGSTTALRSGAVGGFAVLANTFWDFGARAYLLTAAAKGWWPRGCEGS